MTPKLGSTQYGHAAGSLCKVGRALKEFRVEPKRSRDRRTTRLLVVASARFICTKHSVQIGWSQHREVLMRGG